MWEWNWVYTRAQLQLMAIDATITVYKAREKPKHSAVEKPDPEKVEEAVRLWKLKKARRKFDLSKFLGDGYKKKDNNGEQHTEQAAEK